MDRTCAPLQTGLPGSLAGWQPAFCLRKRRLHVLNCLPLIASFQVRHFPGEQGNDVLCGYFGAVGAENALLLGLFLTVVVGVGMIRGGAMRGPLELAALRMDALDDGDPVARNVDQLGCGQAVGLQHGLEPGLFHKEAAADEDKRRPGDQRLGARPVTQLADQDLRNKKILI